jgi:hypothetical protein
MVVRINGPDIGFLHRRFCTLHSGSKRQTSQSVFNSQYVAGHYKLTNYPHSDVPRDSNSTLAARNHETG